MTQAYASVGMDVSQNSVVICVQLPDGQEAGLRWTVPNTLPGAQALAERLAQILRDHAVTGVRLGVEATNWYWWHLACYLRDAPALAALDHAVYAG